ncbi:MAG: TIR domain-containing protein [Clostridia bacterium]|nr:TIR domain-containing protein [Clostridia bacterium]
MSNPEFVFISYSSHDAPVAREVYNYLTDKGISCWMAPQSLHAGQDYPSQIIDAIRNCSAFVLLASHNTNNSEHVSNEVASAFDAGKPLIAVRIENVEFTDEYIYYLKRKHWIDAFNDLGKSMEQLYSTVISYVKAADVSPRPLTGFTPNTAATVKDVKDDAVINEKKKITDRKEMAALLKQLTLKYSYTLYERVDTEEKYNEFLKKAEFLFDNTVRLEFRGNVIRNESGYVDFAVKNLSGNNYVVMHVLGTPGSAKNMLLQLVFFKMMENFVSGASNCLPVYLSVGYYERQEYSAGNEQKEMTQLLKEDLQQFVDFALENKEVRPVVFVDGVREYVTTKHTVEGIVAKILEPFGKFNRMVSRDTGLIKNRQRLKRVFPIAGDSRGGYVFRTTPIETEDKEKLLKVIDCVLDMYEYNLDPQKIYSAICKYKYGVADICLIRLVAKEVFSSYMGSDRSLSDIYESIALNEYGDEESLFKVSGYLFDYVFAERNINTVDGEFGNRIWSLPNKHHTYLDYLLAYYFVHCIENFRSLGDYSFFKMMLTSAANQFIVSMLKDNYDLQECFYEFINSKYEIFDARQKSNAAYWLGRINYNKNLTNQALTFLTGQFAKLKALVKTNNKATQENMDNHFVFRAVCTAMLFHGQANMMDEYLCVVITNDIANAINRGVAVEYFGNDYEMCAFNEYYLDTDPTRGENALKMLNNRIEKALYGMNGKFVENNLVTLLTLLQARIQTKGENLGYDISFYVKKALEYLNAYKFKPQNIASGKILYYFDGVKDDLENYLANGAFDIGPMLYNRCKFMKSVKRDQWVSHGIEDPESVSEHVFSSWLLAMLFLPQETQYEGYNKKEILDMLLIHDMAQTVQGESGEGPLVTKKLEFKTENVIMRKFFLKGTYPDIANLTYFYNIWTGYYNGININAKIAQDINLIQAIYTFYEYYSENESQFTEDDVREWTNLKAKIITEIGYRIYDRMILNNSAFKDILNKRR